MWAAFFLKLEFILDEQSAMYYYQLLYQILQFLKNYLMPNDNKPYYFGLF